MKKKTFLIYCLLSSLLVSFSITSLQAQKKNVLKVGVLGLPLNNVSFGYERALSNNISLSLNVALQGQSDLPDRVLEEVSDISGGSFSGLAITPEVRFYGKKKGATQGFYFAPYFRYNTMDMTLSGVFEGEPTDAEGTLNTYGLGGQLGVQWTIANLITIDWYFLGISVNSYNLDANFRPENQQADLRLFASDIEDSLRDAALIGDKLIVNVNQNDVDVEAPFTFIGLRSGLAVGIKF